ncbi:methionyl-tRNA formyltransferase [Antrihabitans cavernicola]|uniref:Methionyl-tRNA formyltransferase n=1 Tax=Antrihabitans cavernicola TaxID=2495913 RepID=A0A5A7S8S9_9NOCA|nr:methionyl-tRNA formyltransferase [Spelaeibacter cavernicola]KAA0021552.1 methionyl-tRNA formyltransferase [Spelaeibacter cavernicola]
MRIVTFGYQTWGRKTLQALIDSKHEVVLSVTHPPSDHAYKGIWSDSVENLAREHGIPVILTEKADDALIEQVRAAEPDVIVVNSWYTKFPKELYELPPHGTLNLHDSLLPKFTGFSPVLWALISGESEVGLTVHRMDEDLDTGDILIQKTMPIDPDDTGTSLVLKTMELIPDAVGEALDAIESGTATWTPQNPAHRTFFHKRSERDNLIDLSWPAADSARLIRVLSDPYPPAFGYYRGQRVQLLEAGVSAGRYGGTPGRVVVHGDGAVVVTGPEAFRGNNQGLVLYRVRTDDGVEHAAAEFFAKGGYVTDSVPVA